MNKKFVYQVGNNEKVVLYYTILYYTILYYTILYYTLLYYTILYTTILYYTKRISIKGRNQPSQA